MPVKILIKLSGGWGVTLPPPSCSVSIYQVKFTQLLTEHNRCRTIREGVNIYSIPAPDHRYTILTGSAHMINEHCIWHWGNNVLHCNWHKPKCFYSCPGLAVVRRWPKWDMLPHVIHGIIAEPLSTYQGTQNPL